MNMARRHPSRHLRASLGCPPQAAFEVVFNDESLIVINKIAKLLVQPSPKKEKITLTSLLVNYIGQKIFPCHRLDRETTGLLIYAKNALIQKNIMQAFKAGRIKKKYFAFVRGRLLKKKGILEGFILDKEGSRFGEKRKFAKTGFRVIEEYGEWSFLELEPLTGRTNQLRIQLTELGHPILGEYKYAFRRDFPIKFKRLALHACFLSFIHPLSKQRLRLTVDLPADMKLFLSKNRNPN